MTIEATGAPSWRSKSIVSGQVNDLGLGFVLAVWIAFGVAHTVVRIVGNGQLAAADGLSMMAAQSLSVAYQVGQPPLYDWALWAVQQVTGPTAFSAYLTKYIFTTLTGLFVYLGTVAASESRIHGVVASLSLLLLFNVGISIHDQSTHSVAMIAALAMSFHAFVMIAKRGAWLDYVELGIAVAMGVLSKYGYALMPASFIAAFLWSPALRPRILSLRFAASIAIAAAITAPFLIWLLLHRDELAVRTGVALIRDAKASYLVRVGLGVAKLLGSLAVYAAPAIPVLWVLWPQLLRRGMRLDAARGGSLPDTVGLAIAIAIVTSIALVFLSGIDVMRSRYMHVLGLLIPVYAVLFIKSEEFTPRRIAAFLAVLFVVQAIPVAGRALANVFPARPFCSSCNVIQPIGQLAAALAEKGYAEAIVQFEGENSRLGGNLRRYLPKASIQTSRLPAIRGAHVSPDAPCISVDELAPGEEPKSPPGIETEIITVDWPPALAGPKRSSRWLLRKYPKGDRRCAVPAR